MKKILSSLVMFSMVFSSVGMFPIKASAVDNGTTICPDGVTAIPEGGCPNNTSTVTLCKEDTKGNRLSDWTLKLHDNENGPAENDFEGVTGENGCVTFNNVPYDQDGSTHEVLEDMQDGWENVSGLEDVLVNDATETFTVVNRNVTPDPDTATISAKKVVCDSEADLPNWGAGGADITSTTADNWVSESHGNCHLVPWTFEWAPSTTANPGDNQEVGGGSWTTFTNTVSIPVPSNPSYVWVREQIPSTYIPFSGDVTDPVDDNVSAEFYCSTDVLNYDNYDRVDDMVAGETYHCVGFNVQKEKSCDDTDVVQTIVSDTTTTDEDGPSVVLSFIHSAWDAVITGANWIWATNPVVTVPNTDVTKTFTKNFTISGDPISATLDIAADNSYTVKVNGNVVPVTFDQNNFQAGTQDSYDVSSYLIGGVNTLEIKVTNWGVGQSTDPAENPAGLLYKLVTHENDCLPPPPPPLTCNADVNLLENGGFEAPALTNGTWDIIPDSNPLLKWLVNWSNPEENGRLGLEIQNHVAGDPNEGDQHAELDGDHPVTIWQTIPTIPGKEYSLSFKYSPRPGRDLADDSMQVKVDGAVVGADIATDGTPNGNTVWETITRNFVATDSTTKVEIYDNGTDTSFGGYVDNASVRCMGNPQEPTTGTLKVIKHVVGGQATASQFSMHVFGEGEVANSPQPGSETGTDYELNPGSYTVNETGGPSGYSTTFSGNCTSVGGVGVVAGQTSTCTVTNTFVPVDVPPACSDQADNDEDGLNNQFDPGCHSDGNVNNPDSYVPSDNDESNTSNQCGDGKDNDTDGKIDSLDPGCHSDGNVGNGNSYNPNDNDETDVKNNSSHHSSHSGGAPAGQVLGAETSCGIYVDKFIRKGYKNDMDTVKKIQQFLNDYMHNTLDVDGVYGAKTEAAVKAFQLGHKDKILDPWKLLGPTGIFYLTTQTEVNNIMCPTLGLPIPELIPIETNPLAPQKA